MGRAFSHFPWGLEMGNGLGGGNSIFLGGFIRIGVGNLSCQMIFSAIA